MLALSFWRYQQVYLGEISVKSFYLNLIRYSACACARHTLQLDLAKAIGARKQCGFSLVELVVVIALLSIVALASTSLIIDNGDLKRQLETEARWNQIHDAIISPPNLYLNGSPYVRGYVADMGRLPVSIYELISLNATVDHDDNPATPEVPFTYDHDDNDATAEINLLYDDDGDGGTPMIVVEQPAWAPVVNVYTADVANGFTSAINGGWRGPYLYTAGSRQFRDGWGREDVDLGQDFFNFGWVVDTDGDRVGEVTDLVVQSFGSDQEVGGAGDFTEDFPVINGPFPDGAIVKENEWTLSTSPITFNINFSLPFRESEPLAVPPDPGNLPLRSTTATGPEQLVLRVFRYVDNGDAVAEYIDLDDPDDDFEVLTAASTFTVEKDDPTLKVQTITPIQGLPVGQYTALIYCTGIPASALTTDPLASGDASDDVVYDGDCDYDPTTNPIKHSPVYFTLTNNTSQVTLTWDLP